jgi:hypothetical protein
LPPEKCRIFLRSFTTPTTPPAVCHSASKKDLADKIEITASDLPENITRQEQILG